MALELISSAHGGAERDRHQRALFMQEHPCPANGKTRGHCPGYVVDHIKPLCAGGKDRPSNMQWQRAAESKVKDTKSEEVPRHSARKCLNERAGMNDWEAAAGIPRRRMCRAI